MLVVMLFSLASCSAFNKTYEAEGFSIELSPTFVDGADLAEKILEDSSYALEVLAIAVCDEADNGVGWFVPAMCKPEKFEDKREKMIEYLESVVVE